MKMIVGLGNPGKEYENTRHNLGFMILDNFAKFHGTCIDKFKFNGNYTELFVSGEKIILLKPMSFMNLSGEVVSSFVKYFKIDIKDILVISDDLALPFLKFRLRLFGSCGGHNGLRNIEKCLGSNEFKRFRIGISSSNVEVTDYVLGKFSKDDIVLIDSILPRTCDVLNDFCSLSFEKVMNKYN